MKLFKFTISIDNSLDLRSFNPLDTDVFANLIYLIGGGSRWAPTIFYLNIIGTMENIAKFFFIMNDIPCVTKNDNRFSDTYVVYCLDDPKQIFFDFSEKCTTAA